MPTSVESGFAVISLFFFQAEDGIRDGRVTGVQTCDLPIYLATLGAIFFATQLVTALSFLLAERIARRIGLLRTMVFTHVPSNVLLIGVALAPTALTRSEERRVGKEW